MCTAWTTLEAYILIYFITFNWKVILHIVYLNWQSKEDHQNKLVVNYKSVCFVLLYLSTWYEKEKSVSWVTRQSCCRASNAEAANPCKGFVVWGRLGTPQLSDTIQHIEKEAFCTCQVALCPEPPAWDNWAEETFTVAWKGRWVVRPG